MKKPYFIAELGVNFYDTAKIEGISPLEAAKKYVRTAAATGVDAVKFQSYKADTIVSKNSPAYWDLTKEPTPTQYGLFQLHDSLTAADFAVLADCCRENGVAFLSTPFDDDAVEYLNPLMEAYKISSSDLTNLPFIRHIAQKGKPVYLSVGAAYLYEVDRAIQVLREEKCPEICLMHCVLSYPTAYEDANLQEIQTLKRIYPEIKVGYSDHTLPDENMTVLTCALMMGAEVIEKHFTLDKTLQGNDHYHAGDPTDFRKATDNFALTCTVCGTGEKRVLACEQTPRREARRSLVLTRSLRKGEILTERDLAAKRPGTGIEPEYAHIVAGRTVKQDLDEDTVLTWDMV